MKIIEHKQLSDGGHPAKELREWKTLFKAGVPLCPPKKSKSAITLEKFNYQSYEPEV